VGIYNFGGEESLTPTLLAGHQQQKYVNPEEWVDPYGADDERNRTYDNFPDEEGVHQVY
jgi:hypothetical protein